MPFFVLLKSFSVGTSKAMGSLHENLPVLTLSFFDFAETCSLKVDFFYRFLHGNNLYALGILESHNERHKYTFSASLTVKTPLPFTFR
jgi:hypothetical protein